MSTATLKRTLRDALADAYAFRELFAGTYERWEIAGSCRRRKPEVGDVEHVIIPKFIERRGENLFGSTVRVNLLMERTEELRSLGTVDPHVYGRGEHGAPIWRWGELYRGLDFHGFNHEIFSADAENWGSVLAIRTGPADFSRMLVTRLRDLRRRNFDGKVWQCQRCPDALPGDCSKNCRHCQGTSLKPVMVIPVETEQQFFAAAGVAWIEPEKRQ